MTMGTYALIEGGVVINTMVWDGVTELDLAAGVTAAEVSSGALAVIGQPFPAPAQPSTPLGPSS
jgi:hypothetical protein